MKLQKHVRGQNRSSWVCPVHLNYFQVADISISCVFTVDFLNAILCASIEFDDLSNTGSSTEDLILIL